MMDKLTMDGNRVASLAAQSGLLRGGLRDKVGVTRATIAKVFASRPVGVRTARSVAKALRVPLAELLSKEGELSEGALASVNAA